MHRVNDIDNPVLEHAVGRREGGREGGKKIRERKDVPAIVVHRIDDVNNPVLEHSIGRGVGHHQRGKLVLVQLGLGLEVVSVDVTLLEGGREGGREGGWVSKYQSSEARF